jgi:hypothetical protein
VNVTLTLPVAPTLGVPANNTSGIDLNTQAFTWSPPEGAGLHQLTLTSPILTLAVITGGSSVTLPNLSELGLGAIPADTKFDWNIVSSFSANFPTIDSFVVPNALELLLSTDLSQSFSANRSFTTR